MATAAIDAGADLLEVGLPYCDPLADGATLQRASGAALRAGATFDGAVDLLGRVGAARPGLPLVPMCYANQLLAGGGGATAARRLAEAGASGIIVADLTPDEGAPFEAACGTPAWPSSTSWRRRRRRTAGPRSPPARAASCTGSRWWG